MIVEAVTGERYEAAVFVLQCCAMLAIAGLLPLRLWS
jgi:hypothetical protein